MQLPNADRAIIEAAKISSYLLSPRHKTGAAKADFFRRFGFSASNPNIFRNALLDHAEGNTVTKHRTTPLGQVFEIVGPLKSPDGRNPYVCVVWFVRNGESLPRLVTAFPARGPRS